MEHHRTPPADHDHQCPFCAAGLPVRQAVLLHQRNPVTGAGESLLLSPEVYRAIMRAMGKEPVTVPNDMTHVPTDAEITEAVNGR